MKPVQWGVLSTAKIGLQKVIPAMQKADSCRIAAIASRSLSTAQAAADALSIPKAYGSYEDLLADPEIEAVYNPLPNHLHVPLSIAAIEAGKHVLCEKPIAINASEAGQADRSPRQGRSAGPRGLHGSIPPSMAARSRIGPIRENRTPPVHPWFVQLQQQGPPEHTQPGRNRWRGPL